MQRKRVEDEKLLKKYDMATNLDRSLRNDQRFLTIGRKKILTSGVFGPSILTRIAHDVEKIRKSNNKSKLNKSLETLNDAYKILNRPCPRFIRNSQRYLEREFRQLDFQQHLLNYKNDDSFQLPYISTEQITTNINEITTDDDQKMSNGLNESINEKIENELVQNDNEIITSTRNPSPVLIENIHPAKAMLKPKSQVISSMIKLPKI